MTTTLPVIMPRMESTDNTMTNTEERNTTENIITQDTNNLITEIR
jgi:hypothetical protein